MTVANAADQTADEIHAPLKGKDIAHPNTGTKYYKGAITNAHVTYNQFSYIGPSALFGSADAGVNSIDNIHKSGMEDAIAEYKKAKKLKKKLILLKIMGHSRGAVAAGLIAKDFAEHVAKNATDILIELVQFDPVPGQDNFIKMNIALAACTTVKVMSSWFFDVFDRVLPKALTEGAKILTDECLKSANEIRDS